MTTEQKAKAYDEAIEKSKEFYILCKKCGAKDTVDFLEDSFPELKESEDEKIRKVLKHYLEVRRCQTQSDEEYINCNNFLAWLEKQGKEDSSIQQAYEWGYTEGKRIERKHWIEKQKFSEDYNSIDPQFGKPIEQNPAWSEEDEEMFEYTISLLNYNLGCRKWLKSLKERIQPKVKWSEEDEKKRTLLISILEVNHPNDYFKVNPANTLNMEAMHTEELVDWLKSLKERYTWKPSDKQMHAFEQVYDWYNNNFAPSETLTSLYKDLEKLKGE